MPIGSPPSSSTVGLFFDEVAALANRYLDRHPNYNLAAYMASAT